MYVGPPMYSTLMSPQRHLPVGILRNVCVEQQIYKAEDSGVDSNDVG